MPAKNFDQQFWAATRRRDVLLDSKTHEALVHAYELFGGVSVILVNLLLGDYFPVPTT